MAPVPHFCTYFDSRYLLRGLALYESLLSHCPNFHLWILCADDTSYDSLAAMNLPSVSLIQLSELESHDPELKAARLTRSRIEYYFTLTPCLPLYIFNRSTDISVVTYLDADLFFFSDPGPLLEGSSRHSIAIIEHRFPPHLEHLARAGRFNVGWLSFRRDPEGLSCLREWREQCLEWCQDVESDGRYADQKYLDAWPERFQNLTVLTHKGANLAPWNLAAYRIERRGERLWVDDDPLVFFHFHGLRRLKRHVYDAGLKFYGASSSGIIGREIYGPYIAMLDRLADDAPALVAYEALAALPRNDARHATTVESSAWSWLKSSARFWIDLGLGRYLVVWNGSVLTAGR